MNFFKMFPPLLPYHEWQNMRECKFDELIKARCDRYVKKTMFAMFLNFEGLVLLDKCITPRLAMINMKNLHSLVFYFSWCGRRGVGENFEKKNHESNRIIYQHRQNTFGPASSCWVHKATWNSITLGVVSDAIEIFEMLYFLEIIWAISEVRMAMEPYVNQE